MTNGEKIKDILKPRTDQIRIYGDWVEIEIQSLGINFSCELSWWNAEYKEPTTKNDLGVDCIVDVLGSYTDLDIPYKREIAEDILTKLPSVTPQEPKTFKWCTDCKEYDQEKHCCHRWSKVIRDNVEEMKQEPKAGHWIKGYTFPDGAYWKCDKCNELIKVKIPMRYCNNCGAKMVESQESEG